MSPGAHIDASPLKILRKPFLRTSLMYISLVSLGRACISLYVRPYHLSNRYDRRERTGERNKREPDEVRSRIDKTPAAWKERKFSNGPNPVSSGMMQTVSRRTDHWLIRAAGTIIPSTKHELRVSNYYYGVRGKKDDISSPGEEHYNRSHV